MKELKRNSNIELLRIISMFMIVISHYSVHNDIVKSALPLGLNRYLLEISVLGNIGVILFVLITGYFSINNKEPFKIRKLFVLLFETFIYSSLIFVILLLLGKETFSIKLLIKSLLPITFKQYWFMTAFVLLYIFIPYINKVLNSLNRDEHLKLIVICLFIFSIIKTFTTRSLYGNDFVQLIYLYIIGAFFGKYKNDKLSGKKLNVIILVLSTLALLSSVALFDVIGTKYEIFAKNSYYLFSRTSIVVILFSVSLFNLFSRKKEFNSKFINGIASCVLGVYLISDNNLLKNILWTDIFDVSKYVNSNYLFLHMIACVSIIFVVCIIIDFIRKNTIERFGLFLFDKVVKNKRTN